MSAKETSGAEIQRSARSRWIRALSALFAVPLLLLVSSLILEKGVTHQYWARWQTERENSFGEKTDLGYEVIVPKPVPDSENGACVPEFAALRDYLAREFSKSERESVVTTPFP